MNLTSPRLEMTALKSIMAGEQVASWVLPRVTAEHFGLDSTSLTREIYNRMMRYVRKGGAPRWDDLIEDMALSQEARDEMSVATAEVVPNRKVAKRLVERLDEYRRVRIFFEMTVKTGSILKADKIDLDELTDKIADYLFKARSTGDVTECMLHVGDEKLDTKFIEKLLVGDEMEFLPTGFRAFDSRNQGIPRGTLFLVAGTTGGGKTVIATNIAVHQARIGLRTLVVSLEMSRENMCRRLLSAMGEIPLTEINHVKSLSEIRRKQILQVWIDFHKQVRRNGGRFTVMAPTEDVSMEDLLTLARPSDYDNKIVDYVGLLKGMDGEDQARRLGAATRYAARDAAATNSVNTVLAQLSKDGLVRYSRAMEEHAGLSWQWNYSYESEARESKIITIKQPKARQLEAFDFHLQERFDIMKAVDLDASALTGARKGSRASDKQAKGKRTNASASQSQDSDTTYQM